MSKLTRSDTKGIHIAATLRAISVIGERSQMSSEHRKAISELIGLMCDIVTREDCPQNRVAVPMATGLGKSVSLTSFVITLINGGFTDTSILITTETLEELKDIHQTILENISEANRDFLGVFYSPNGATRQRGIPGVSAGSQSDYPIVFMSHAGIETSDDIRVFNEYQGRPRDITLWDEALIKAAGFFLTSAEVLLTASSAQIKSGMSPVHSVDPEIIKLTNWLSSISGFIRRGHMDLVERKSEDFVTITGALSFGELEDITGASEKFMDAREVKIVSSLAKMTSRNIRLQRGQREDVSVLSYDTKIPDELRRIVVLDASSTVRAFYQQDKSMIVRDTYGGLKDFSNVTLKHFKGHKCGSGKLNGKASKLRKLVSDVADVLLAIPEAEKVLICTSKTRNKTYANQPGVMRVLEGELEDRGLVGYLAQDRIKTITWGRHKATNAYADCKHIIAIGIQRRNPNELAATSYGQSEGALGADMPISYISKTEQVGALQQLIGRGTARAVTGGMANEAFIYLFEAERFTDLEVEGQPSDMIQLAMPNIKYSDDLRNVKANNDFNVLLRYIKAKGLTKISARAMWGLVEVKSKPAREGLKAAVAAELGWIVTPRSIEQAGL